MFASKRLTEKSGKVTLVGQLRLGAAFCILPVSEGVNTLQITVHSGKVRINHCAYTPDGGTWLSDPSGNPAPHTNMEEGSHQQLNINIGKSYDRLDMIQIVNRASIKPAIFEYSLQ